VGPPTLQTPCMLGFDVSVRRLIFLTFLPYVLHSESIVPLTSSGLLLRKHTTRSFPCTYSPVTNGCRPRRMTVSISACGLSFVILGSTSRRNSRTPALLPPKSQKWTWSLRSCSTPRLAIVLLDAIHRPPATSARFLCVPPDLVSFTCPPHTCDSLLSPCLDCAVAGRLRRMASTVEEWHRVWWGWRPAMENQVVGRQGMDEEIHVHECIDPVWRVCEVCVHHPWWRVDGEEVVVDAKGRQRNGQCLDACPS